MRVSNSAKLVLAAFFVTQGLPATAGERTEAASTAAPSIQEQLEELKDGQRQLRKELEEIRKLLEVRAAVTNNAAGPEVPKISSVDVFGEPYAGTNTARIAIIEYSDFDCSFCSKYARKVFPRIHEDYVKTGKVRYFFRDLPELEDTNAWLKARAARCAGDQGKFWEMHELLFALQGSPLQDPAALAQKLGLDPDSFAKCLSSGKYQENIQRSVDGAKGMGIFGTPAFLFGSVTKEGDFVWVKKVLIGAQTYESVKSILDEQLTEVEKSKSAL